MGIEIRDVRAICTAPEGVNLVAVKIETSEPGLYGVGTVVGDMYGDVYDYHVPGINLGGPCTTFGYLLGKNLHNGTW